VSRLSERTVDAELGVPVPFVSEYDDGRVDHARTNRKRIIQCALSRICGLCGNSLGWPVAFLGSAEEAEANAFTYPPLHSSCAEEALQTYPPLGAGFLGPGELPRTWALVTTGGFELERPADRTGDQLVRFHPNAIREDRRIPAGHHLRSV
jgi:hypothetical protein